VRRSAAIIVVTCYSTPHQRHRGSAVRRLDVAAAAAAAAAAGGRHSVGVASPLTVTSPSVVVAMYKAAR